MERGEVPPTTYGIVRAGGPGLFADHMVLPEAVLFLAAGAWLFLRTDAPGSGLVRALARRLAQAVAGRPSRRALVLLPVLALAVEVLDKSDWLGQQWWTAEWTLVIGVVLAVGAFVLTRIAPSAAAILAVYEIIVGAVWRPAIPTHFYGVVELTGQATRPPWSLRACSCWGAGVFLMPRVVREHIAGAPDRDLAALTDRVQPPPNSAGSNATCTTARRPGWSPSASRCAAEKMFTSNPDAALALVSQRGPPLRGPHGPDPPEPRGGHAARPGQRRRRGRGRPGAGHRPDRGGAPARDL